jgi:hypothetical protein
MAQEAKIDGNLINDSRPLAVETQAASVVTIQEPLIVDLQPVAASNADWDTPAVNVAAVVNYPAAAGLSHVITGAAWSYLGGIPVGGRLTITTTTEGAVFDIDIAEEGAGIVSFPSPKIAAVNDVMTITLTAGGAAITGKVSVLNHWTE